MRRRELASGLVTLVLLTTSAGMVVAQDEDVRMGDPVTDSSDGPRFPMTESWRRTTPPLIRLPIRPT